MKNVDLQLWRFVLGVLVVFAVMADTGLARVVQQTDCRIIEHAMGRSCVPPQPGRVVVLDTGELDIALALGVMPVGAVTPYELGRFPAYLLDRTDGITPVGTIPQPDLERIVSLKPDLIIGSSTRHAGIYGQLSAIAPTVFSEDIGASWKQNLKLFAKALGGVGRAEDLLRQYHARLNRLRDSMAARGSIIPTVSLVRGMQDHVRIYLQDSFSGSILDDAGLPRPAGQRKEGFAITLRSPDTIGRLDGDIVVMSFYGSKHSALLSQWMESPFWSLLSAAKSDDVREVEDSYWMLGLGPIAAMRVVEDLERILADG